MADHLGSAFGALAGAALPGAGADLPLSPQWRQPFGRTTSVEQPMKSALIGPWDGNNSGAPASKPDAAAKQPGAAWRGPDGPPSRDPKWPEKDRPDYNGARDRPAPAGRWREREEDSRDRNNTWEADRWGSVEEPRRWQEDRGSDRWGDASGRGRGRPPADERWVDRKPSGTPTGEREWLPGMPPEPELPKRPSIQDRWASESTDRADRRSAEDRWRTPGGAGASLAGVAASAEVGFTSTHAGRGRGFALGRGRGMKSSGPAAPGSGAPDRWDAARASHVDRQDSMAAAGGNGVGGSICGGSQSGVRKYSPPQMSKIFNHLVSSHGDKLPMPRINPEVAMQYSEYLAGMAAEAAEAMAAAQLGGNGSNSGPTDTAGSNALSAPSSSNPAQQSVSSSSKPPLQLPVTHELYLHDQWVYKDPQGVTQGPFSRLDILDWLAYNYFGEDLPIRAAALESAPFIPLGQMMKMWDAIEHGRPIGPPGFAPAAPPVIQPVSSESVQQQVAQQQPAPASAPVASMSSMGSAASQSVEISQQPPQQASNTPAAGSTTATSIGSAQRTSSLLETLLGRKLASEPAPSVPQQSPGALGAAPQGSVGAGAPVPEIQPQPGPFTLDPPVQLHNAGSSGIGAGSLGGLGSLGGPLGGGFNSGLPGSGMGPGGMSGMGPGGMGPGAWGTPLGGPGGPLPGGPGGPMLPGWGREPLVGGYDPLRRPDMHPGMHAGAGIWGNAPYQPEGPHLGPGPFVPNQAPPEGPPPTGRSAMPDAMLGAPSVPAPGPGPTPASAPASAPAPAPAQQQLVAPPSPQPSAWSAPPVANVGVARSLADIQREQAMEAARLAALREHQQHQQAMAEAASQQGPPPPPAPLPQELQAQSAWGGNAVPDAYRPISGLPPALQQIFAAANKPAQAGSEASIPPPESGEALESATVLTDSTAAGSASGKKKKTPQLVLQEQPKMQPAPSITAPPAVTATSEDAAGAPAPPRPEPKLAPWALTAAAKLPTAGMTLREIQMQEAEAAARAARASAAAQEAAATQNAVATAAATPAAPAPASASPWAKIAAVSPGPNNTAFSPAPPPAPPAAASAWRPTAAPAAPSLPAVPSSPAPAAAVADSSPSRKSAPVLSAAAAVVAPAARGGRPAPAPAQAADPPPAPVGVTGTAPRGTTLAELLEKQLNPASAAPAQTAPKAWGGAASKPPPVTNLRAVLYEESAADLEGGAVDEDLSDVLPMLQQKQQQQLSAPAAASTNGGWAVAQAPPPGPTLRDIQQQEEEARRRAAAAAQPPARAASATVAPAAPATSEDDGLFWDYTPAPTSAARAAPVEAPKPAPAAKPAAPAPQASGSTSARGGWASAVGAPAPVMTAAALAAKGGAAAAPAARMPAAAVAGAKAAPAMVAARSAAPAPATSTSYAPAPAAAPGGEDAAGLFDGEIQMSADFRNWCRSKMVEFFGNDDLSLVHFLLTVSSRSEVADYCQMYMRGKPNVSTFVAEFLKHKDADLARSSSSKKGKGGSGGGATAKGVSTKGVSAVSEWQKAASSAPQTAAGAVKKGTPAGGKAVKKVGGITATVPGFSLLSDRA